MRTKISLFFHVPFTARALVDGIVIDTDYAFLLHDELNRVFWCPKSLIRVGPDQSQEPNADNIHRWCVWNRFYPAYMPGSPINPNQKTLVIRKLENLKKDIAAIKVPKKRKASSDVKEVLINYKKKSTIIKIKYS